MEKAAVDRRDRLNEPSDPNRTAPPQGGDGSTGAAGNVGGYNNFWLDPGERVAVVDGQRRSSLIIDPPDGRIPPLTPRRGARGNAAPTRRGRSARAAASTIIPNTARSASAACCRSARRRDRRSLPNYFYNNNQQIVQTPDSRDDPDGDGARRAHRPHRRQHLPKHIRQWMGDSIGHWEGDTLVVDTTNFPPTRQSFRGSSENLHVVERFRRVDAKTIIYRFTVDDPTTFTAPWTGEIPLPAIDELIYEYACHEGNYALGNVLSGARNEEKRLGTKQEK